MNQVKAAAAIPKSPIGRQLQILFHRENPQNSKNSAAFESFSTAC